MDVRLQGETVWLTLNQMAELFDRDKSVISRYLKDIFQSRELSKKATVAKNATVRREGGRQVERIIICITARRDMNAILGTNN